MLYRRFKFRENLVLLLLYLYAAPNKRLHIILVQIKDSLSAAQDKNTSCGREWK